jgi:hypothetical protein
MTDPTSPEASLATGAGDGSGALTPFQITVARAFFTLPSAQGFLLAGGAALAAHGMTMRPTQDLDLFTSPGRGDVRTVLTAFAALAEVRGWDVEVVRETDTFVRGIVRDGADAVVVDLAVDATPERPPTVTFVGPALDPEELAGRKLVALFDRAEARDFADVYVLTRRCSTQRLLELAAAIDAGFDVGVLAVMIDSLGRFTDEEIPVPLEVDVGVVREFFRSWSRQLRESQE